MAPKTKRNIEDWVATAIRTEFDLAGDAAEEITTTYEHNQGDYERIRAHLPGVPIEADERYAHAVAGYTVRFEILDTDGDDDYLLRVRID